MYQKLYKKPLIVFLSIYILSFYLLLGCQQSGSSSTTGGGGAPTGTAITPVDQNNSQYASTPQPCNVNNLSGYGQTFQCHHMQAYYQGFNPQAIQWNYGYWYWPYQYISTSANCGCPSGYFIVYGPYGVACAPMGYYNSGLIYYDWGGAYWNIPQNIHGLNIPQYYYEGPNGSFTYRCLQGAAQGCDTRLNNCPSGSFCSPVGGGSTIGLCIKLP